MAFFKKADKGENDITPSGQNSKRDEFPDIGIDDP
jgi:hypothetical protein